MAEDELVLADVERALNDARALEANQRRIASRALTGSWILRLVMHAVGVILFVPIFGVRLSPLVTAIIGLMVVVGTVLGQQFRPDVKFINAKAHILQLRRMLTTAEHELAAARAGDPAAQDPDDIANHIERVVTEVERNHHLDYALMRERIVSVMPRDSQIHHA